MTSNQFRDRLDPLTYETDEAFASLYENHPDEPDALDFSARLFRRLTALATAYELHTLPLIDGSVVMTFDQTRCQSLLDEIEFVEARVDDQLVTEVAVSIARYLTVRVRRPGWTGVITIDLD